MYQADAYGQQSCAQTLDGYIKSRGWRVNSDPVYEMARDMAEKRAIELTNTVEFDLYPAPPVPPPNPDNPDPLILAPDDLEYERYGVSHLPTFPLNYQP
jgi:hypothetical protein